MVAAFAHFHARSPVSKHNDASKNTRSPTSRNEISIIITHVRNCYRVCANQHNFVIYILEAGDDIHLESEGIA